jgi:hypothetical protein
VAKKAVQSAKHNWKAKMVYVDPDDWKKWMIFNEKMYQQSTSARLRAIISADLNAEPGMIEKYDFDNAYIQLAIFGTESKRLLRLKRRNQKPIV